MNMPQVSGFLYGRLGIEKRLVVDAIIHIGIDGEIAHAKRGEILEEVSTLTGIYTIVCQTGLNNDTCRTDVGPFHWNTQPSVTASPASRANQNVVFVLI